VALNAAAIKAANEDLWKAHPELRGRQLTLGPEDTAYRREWMKRYKDTLEEQKSPPAPPTGPAAQPKAVGDPVVDCAIKKKAQDIEKQLDDASWFFRDNVARNIVSTLSDEEIRNLSTSTRNHLMRELLDGYVSKEDKAALKRLYSVKYIDPDFEKIDKANRDNMIQKLKNDPEIVAAKANWATMSADERFKIMQKVADHQADAYGISKTTLERFDEPPKDGYITEGYYQHSDGKLHINTNPSSSFGNFDDALDTVTHENGHRYQHKLIDDLDNGKIKPGDPLYDQAETFKLNNEYYTNDKPEYFTQPMENHSRTTGDAAKSAIP
jgi:hypothetical protein